MRITAIQVEMDGNDAGAIVRGLTEAMQGRPVQTSAEVAEVLALPAPARNGRKNGHRGISRKGAKAQRTAQIAPKPLGVSEAIRMAIAAGPKRNDEICAFLGARGVESESGTISTILCQMRKRNEIYKSDEDFKWRPAEKR